MAAATSAAGFLAAFAGNLLAGAPGTLWIRLGAATFFASMTAVTGISVVALFARWSAGRGVS